MSSFYNYRWADDTLATARNENRGKPVANNTRLFRRSDDRIALKFHAVDVVTFNSDGTWTLRAEGWHTLTTMQRIRNFSPTQLFSERGEWFVWTERTDRDPMPERFDRSIPKPYHANDPGPEPVKSKDGCRNGQLEFHEKLTSHYDFQAKIGDMPYRKFYGDEPFDGLLSASTDSKAGNKNVLRYGTMGVYYGEVQDRGWGGSDAGWLEFTGQTERWTSTQNRVSIDGIDWQYRQCPHCKEFDRIHEAWKTRMEGSRWGYGGLDKQTGYRTYREMMDLFGSQEEWRQAYLDDYRARRTYLKEQREWEQRNRVPFFDGITVDEDGYAPRLRATGPSPAKLRRHEAAVKKMKGRIDKYIDGFIKQLVKGMNMPSAGDCWFCCLKDQDGQTWGDMGDGDHLLEHMKDRYYVPSLLTNAMLEAGYQPTGVFLWLDMNPDTQTMGGKDTGRKPYDTAKRALRKYMNKRLIPAAPTE
jgi:hypothetical protein